LISYRKIEDNERRITAGEGPPISNLIALYSTGLIAKMKNAEYALSKLIEFSVQIDSSTSTSQFSASDKVHFYLDSYFAFIYSSFDVIAQIANQKLRLNTDENLVSFRRLKNNLNQNYRGISIQITIEGIFNSNFFKALEKYRNCSTHRRQICIVSRTTTTTQTRGYSVTVPMPNVSHVLCDDPLTLNPRFIRNREMINYCSKIFNRTQKEIINILKSL